MKVILKLENLTCANCASKIEDRAIKIQSVKSSKLDFASQKLYLEYEKNNVNELVTSVKKIVKQLEPKVKVKLITENDKLKENGNDEKEESKKELKKNIIEVLVAIAILVLATTLSKSNVLDESIRNNISLVLYLISYVISGREVIKAALNNLKTRDIFDENFLMFIATIGAFFIGEYLEGVLVMIFYKAGEAASDYAISDSRKSIKELLDLKVSVANLKTENGSKEIDVKDIEVGDILVVKMGERVPVDSIIVKGNSMIDTSSITGESVPKNMKEGDAIYSGSINKTSIIEIKAKKTYNESEINKMIELIENSTVNKTNTEKFITRFAKVYTPIVVIIALLIAIVPIILKGNVDYTYIYKALSFLVVSCPCALVLSVPLGYFAGIGKLSKEGILLKGTNIFDEVYKTNVVAFDKTGTLTKGNFEVQEIVLKDENISKEVIVKYAYLAEYNSNHPVADAIKEYAKKLKLDRYEEEKISEVKEEIGFGIKASFNKNNDEIKNIIIGNEKILSKEKVEFEKCEEVGTILYVALNNKYVGHIIIADFIKEESNKVIKILKDMKMKKILMLTGDNEDIARKVGEKISIDEVHASLTPQKKYEIVNNLKCENNNVLFVGDGMNDAPVMTTSNTSIAMGTLGSDVSLEAADVVIMDDNILKIPTLLKVSKKVRNIIVQNIAFALFIKLLVLALIFFGFTNMFLAVLSDVGVTLIAVLNSMRILK